MRQLITTSHQVGEILRGRRKSRGMSQQHIASKLSISQGRLSAIESNPETMTLERLLTLANLLGLELILQDKAESAQAPSEW